MRTAPASLEDGGVATLAAPNMMKQPPAITRFAYATGSRPLDGYTIKRGVGAGGFGEVYFAVSDAGKEVAIKRIQRNLDIEIRGVSQCLNLKHPHLVSIHDIRYDDEGQAWVVMEYVRGESLKEIIERHPQGMSAAEMVGWFRSIAGGVAYLHDHGIVHRDLKPGNIFIDEGVVKIGDYGLSKYISCSRRSGQTESVGTFHYMAPEIGRGVYGKEIDVYALGIILYELLTGRVPFDGESSHEIIMKHLTALPDVSPLPEKIRPVVEKALFKDPAKRFHHVAEMMASVEAAVGNAPLANAYALRADGQATGKTLGADRSATFIGSEPTEGIVFGPVQQVAIAEAVPESSPFSTSQEEPIARAIHDAWKNLVGWWFSPALNRVGRIALAVLFVFLFFTNAGWIMPLAIVLGTMYLVYFGVRAITLSVNESPKPSSSTPRPVAAAMPIANPVSAPAQPVVPTKAKSSKKRRKWQDVARERLRGKPQAERISELTGSMLLSTFVVAVVTVLTLVVAGFPIDGSVRTWSAFAWIGVTSLLGTWAVLIPAKFWEGSEGDGVRRRFVHLFLGLLVGAAAFGLTNFLDQPLKGIRLVDTPVAWRLPAGTMAADKSPMLPMFLAYFGGMFLLMRWWTQADPIRAGRFSVGTLLVTFLVATFWQVFWPFPQPWSYAVPLTMTIALQVSSSWMSHEDRNQVRKMLEA